MKFMAQRKRNKVFIRLPFEVADNIHLRLKMLLCRKRGHWFSMVDLNVTLPSSTTLPWECSTVQMRSSVLAEFMTTVESLWVPQQYCPFTETSALMFGN